MTQNNEGFNEDFNSPKDKTFDNNNNLTPEDFINEMNKSFQSFEPIKHNKILAELIEQITQIDFEALAFPDKEKLQENGQTDFKLKQKHFSIISIEQIIEIAKTNNWGICKHNEFVYLYNGAYWALFDSAELQSFFGDASEKMGVNKFDARHYIFRENLFKQFLAVANLPKPEIENDIVLINLKNGTFEISPQEQKLREPNRADFLTYQLPFEFNTTAKAPLFQHYLNTVQPDPKRQMILAEYLGYLFIKPSTLKLEKTLLLYGGGANGKSVFFEVVNALLGGNENVSNFSLQSLTNDNGYFRAMLANKLVNYASEISGKLETNIFKQLVSGEPVEARLPYGKPFTIYNYAKLIFNCNELPKDVEQTTAFFRRFLIIPFEITIPESEQDKELSKKIITSELSGVFNWVLEGLKRLLEQKKFTHSEAVEKQLEDYRLQSDSVQLFLIDEGIEKSVTETTEFSILFEQYKKYCTDCGYHFCSKKKFSERLNNAGFVSERKTSGVIVYAKKTLF
jgi:putative DNA primase/helicase